jgi:hypothetical protein
MPALTNARQENLAQLLATGQLSKVKACQEAGYKVKDHDTSTASRYSNHPDVLARKAEIIQARHNAERMANERAIEQASVSKEWLVTRWKYMAERGIRGTKPVFNDKGEQTGWTPTGSDNQTATKALTELGRLGGYYVEKVEIGGPGELSRLNDDELQLKLIEVGESIGLDPKLVQKAIEGKVE